MILLIHYLVKSPVKDLSFNFTIGGSINGQNLELIRGTLARHATQKLRHRVVTEDEIVIAGIFPIPDDEPAQKGGA